MLKRCVTCDSCGETFWCNEEVPEAHVLRRRLREECGWMQFGRSDICGNCRREFHRASTGGPATFVFKPGVERGRRNRPSIEMMLGQVAETTRLAENDHRRRLSLLLDAGATMRRLAREHHASTAQKDADAAEVAHEKLIAVRSRLG